MRLYKPAERGDECVEESPGEFAYLGVTDTGVGMSAEVREHIFEPFFTTKEARKGTGLGLSTVHGIVRQNGGWIRVSSEPGKGTTFRIYLPLMPDEKGNPEGGTAKQGLEGTETVLLVEDDAEIRQYSRTVLERYGYRVLYASNGPEAIELAGEYPDLIHLLVSDVVLPKMSGMALAERLKKERPEMKVLFASGYPAGLGSRMAAETELLYLQKPFSPEALAAKVREALAT